MQNGGDIHPKNQYWREVTKDLFAEVTKGNMATSLSDNEVNWGEKETTQRVGGELSSR